MSSTTDTSIEFYDSLWTRTKRVDQHHKCRMRAIQKLLADLPAGGARRILEPGCGSGIVSELLSGYGDVTGIDQSPVGVQTAQQRTRGRFLVGVLPAIPASEKDYDVCVLSQVLEHFSDEDRVSLLRNCHAAVRPGGHMILTTPNRPVADRVRMQTGEAEPIENWLDVDELHTLMAATGWKPLKTRFAFSFFPVASSRHRWLRAVRFLTYDVLHLRGLVEDLTSGSALGDCTAVLAVRQ
jgi:SAM-dependent methyltransferase